VAVAGRVSAAAQGPVLDAVQHSFMTGLHAGCLVAGGVRLVGALGALALPGRPRRGPGRLPVALPVAGHAA
jgi:hypothetical protein